LLQTLKSENIEFVVAPYEADAQLAYLSNLETEKGGIEAVITEDSDLIAYGCPAVRTSLKLWSCASRFTTLSFNFNRSPVFWILIRSYFEQVIFKMDRDGNGERIELEKVFSAESCKPSFQSFDMKLFTGDFLVECNNTLKNIHVSFFERRKIRMPRTFLHKTFPWNDEQAEKKLGIYHYFLGLWQAEKEIFFPLSF